MFPPKGVVGCLKASLARLGIEKCDLYQVHGHIHYFTSIETVAKGLAECVKLGLTRTVGVSNYSTEHMIQMYDGGFFAKFRMKLTWDLQADYTLPFVTAPSLLPSNHLVPLLSPHPSLACHSCFTTIRFIVFSIQLISSLRTAHILSTWCTPKASQLQISLLQPSRRNLYS